MNKEDVFSIVIEVLRPLKEADIWLDTKGAAKFLKCSDNTLRYNRKQWGLEWRHKNRKALEYNLSKIMAREVASRKITA